MFSVRSAEYATSDCDDQEWSGQRVRVQETAVGAKVQPKGRKRVITESAVRFRMMVLGTVPTPSHEGLLNRSLPLCELSGPDRSGRANASPRKRPLRGDSACRLWGKG